MTVPTTEPVPTATPPTPPTPPPTPPADPPTPPTPPSTSADPEPLGDAGQKAIDRMKEELKTAKREKTATATELQAAQARIAELEKAQMTENERAVAEAETRGRTQALTEVGEQLARARFDALAGRRNRDITTEDITKTLEYVDLRRFVNDKGEINETELAAAVERLVPEVTGPTRVVPSYDGGARQTGQTTSTVAPGMDRVRAAYKTSQSPPKS